MDEFIGRIGKNKLMIKSPKQIITSLFQNFAPYIIVGFTALAGLATYIYSYFTTYEENNYIALMLFVIILGMLIIIIPWVLIFNYPRNRVKRAINFLSGKDKEILKGFLNNESGKMNIGPNNEDSAECLIRHELICNKEPISLNRYRYVMGTWVWNYLKKNQQLLSKR